MEVGVVGAGYVGLVAAACFAEVGHNVAVADSSEARIEELKAGICPIYEPWLDQFLTKNATRLAYRHDVTDLVPECDALFMCVGTPSYETGEADLRAVASVSREIGRVLPMRRRWDPLVVVNKSTVPPGSLAKVAYQIRAERGATNFVTASNPEFLREGQAIDDMLSPERIVIGTTDHHAATVLTELYDPMRERNDCPVVLMTPRSAEMVKYAANAFLAAKVSFINEIAEVCEAVDAEVDDVAYGMGLDERIGLGFLGAGLGWGGSCFPKDVGALTALTEEMSIPAPMVHATLKTNDAVLKRALGKIKRGLAGELDGKAITILGTAFKPRSDDTRSSRGLVLAQMLKTRGALVTTCDPKADADTDDPEQATINAEGVIVATAWEQFRAMDLEALADRMEEPRFVLDGRNAWDAQRATQAGLSYDCFGRKGSRTRQPNEERRR